MTDWSNLMLERSVAASPIWIQLRDAFTGLPPAGPLTIVLERDAGGGTWVALEHRHQLSADGDLAFVNLGRTHDPGAVGTFDVRVTVTRPDAITETAGGATALVTTVTAWSPDSPVVPQTPDLLRLFPGPSYAYPGGTPLLAGRVVDSGGDPAGGARVWASETVQNSPVVEETRCDAGGRFRLALRWSAGTTTVQAELGAQTGAVVVAVPDDLSTTQQITLT